MEESEKRRERLSAMRALHRELSGQDEGGPPGAPAGLCNPLLDTPREAPAPGSTPRFDFYTDPMAAFSGNRTRPAASSSYPRPGPEDASPPGVCQMRSDYPPNRGMYRPQGPYPVPYRPPAPRHWVPRDMAGPPPIYRGPPPEVGSSFGGGNVHPRHQGYPMFKPDAGSGFGYGRGRGQSFGNGPGYDSGFGGRYGSGGGRGRGRWDGGNRGFVMGRSGGRGRGFDSHGPQLGESPGPENFYHTSMVENPWQHMEPVLWKGLDGPTYDSGASGSSSSWLPKSISAKKQRVSEPTFKSSPGQSLAEYLAASFKEATDDESGQ